MIPRHWLYTAAIILLTAASTSGQRIAEADRYIKLGTRLSPLPPGEGGQLVVRAPADLCADASHVLEVRDNPEPSTVRPVARLVAGPSSCRWSFDGVHPGQHHALMQAQADGRIVATGHAHVTRGSSTEMTLEPLQVEIEGRLTIEGFAFESFPLASDLRLVFGFQSYPAYEWSTPLDATGRYRVKIGGVDPKRPVCAHIQRAHPLNFKRLEYSKAMPRCPTFVPGLNRFDIEDAGIPPGVLRVDVPAVPGAPFGAFVRLTVGAEGQPSDQWYTTFKALRGIRGDYMADLNRKYTIELTAHGATDVLATSQVTLTSERPVADVRLEASVKR